MTPTSWQDADQAVIVYTYARYPLMLVRGQGTKVWDSDGREYLDFLGGLAVTTLGHCHPEVVSAVTEQAGTLMHVSNFFGTMPGIELAQILTGNGGLDKIFFCNSGAEANEAAIKMARKYHARKGRPDKYGIVTAEGSFHGRTLGALAATGKPALREGFGPTPGGFKHVPWNDAQALRDAVDENTAAVLLEPVLGEGGIQIASQEFLTAAREVTTEHDAFLILDEIQCGLGRTGTLFAYENYGIKPDIVTLAKGLANGLPIGAVCAAAEAATGLQPGDHGTTFGANPVSCAAAVATLKVILRDDLPGQARSRGAQLLTGLREKLDGHPAIKEIRGRGLMVGIDFHSHAKEVLQACRDRGLLANVTADTVLRFLPPLNVSAGDVDQAVDLVAAAVAEAAGSSRAAG